MTEVRRLDSVDGELAYLAITTLKSEDWEDGGAPKSLSADYLSRFLDQDDHHLVVALDGDTPIGYLLAYELARVDRDQRMMFFYEIGVHEEHRRLGVGKALISELKTICQERGMMKMWVETNESNEAAMRLYASAGGTLNEERDIVHWEWARDGF